MDNTSGTIALRKRVIRAYTRNALAALARQAGADVAQKANLCVACERVRPGFVFSCKREGQRLVEREDAASSPRRAARSSPVSVQGQASSCGVACP